METCKSYSRCGACSLLTMDYGRQLERKRLAVCDAFDACGLRLDVDPVEGMEVPYHYRNKVISYVTMQGTRTVCGLYEEYSHKVVYTPGCLLQNETLNAVLAGIENELNRLKIRPESHGGVLKNVLLRIGVSTGQVMVVFVTSDDMFHGRKELVSRLVAAFPQISTVIQNINPRHTSVVLGPKERVLYGSGSIYDDLMGNRFKISSRSFYQINPEQTAKLYSKAISLASLHRGDVLMDAFCGIGTIGLSAASSAGNVIGVEINDMAVRDAIANARANKIPNARFYTADVSMFMRDFDLPVDVLILDPPRSGCDEEFLRSVLKMAPRRIVYISCNPQTQARDIAFLKRQYIPGGAYPFDMFPHTSHIENIVPLTMEQVSGRRQGVSRSRTR